MSVYPNGNELALFITGIFLVTYIMHRIGYIDKLIDKRREYDKWREQHRWPE